MTYLTELRCPKCNETYSADELQTLCSCGSPLLAQYDLQHAKSELNKNEIAIRPPGMWKYREVLPVRNPNNIISLGEGGTPLLCATDLGSTIGMTNLIIKDESGNPTGSFKARGLSAAVSKAKELGVKKVALPSAGNAAGALSAYAAKAGMEAYVFMPVDVPKIFQRECQALGAKLELIDGLITDCGAAMAERKDKEGWFAFSTLKEPYRLEGKKTMGYELAEQFGWKLPDVIIYPTGGGTGLIGMWKAFAEMKELGWLESEKLPRMVSVQSSGCAPIVRAFEQNLDHAPKWENASTFAAGLRVPAAVGDALMLNALRESNGTAIAVDDSDIATALKEFSEAEGIFVCPEGAATWAACKKLLEDNWLAKDEQVVLFNTGTGLKYVELIEPYLDKLSQ